LARTLMQAGDQGAARQTLQALALKAGFDPEMLVQIGRLQLASGNPDGAQQMAAKALQSNPNDLQALALMVEVAGRRGNAAEVDRTLAALQAKHPQNPVTLTTAGHVALSRGQLPKAVAAYKTAFERAPSSPLALLLVQAQVANNEAPKALVMLEGWSARQPRDAVVLRALAELQFLQGKTDAARRSYDTLLKADPEDPQALAGYADLLHRLNDPAALTMAQKAHQLAPQNATLAAGYGRLLVERGDAEAGVRLLREARLREPANGQLRWQLASALAKVGRQAEARDELRAALASAQPPAAGPELDRLKGQLGL
jgi:cellulose synthase operon protein C